MTYARDGGLCGGIFLGVPLLLCAAGAWAWGLPGVPAPVAVTGFGLAGLVGLLLRVRVEVGEGHVDHVVQLGAVLRRRRTPLASFQRIALVYQRGRVDLYHLRLQGTGPDVHLETLYTAPAGRVAADVLAAATGLPIVETADVPAPTLPPTALRAAPDLTVLQAALDPGGAVFSVPAPPLGWRFGLSLAAGGLIPGFCLLGAALAWSDRIDPPPANPQGMALLLLGFGAAALLPAVLPVLAASSRVEQVRLDGRTLHLRWRSWVSRGERVVDGGEVREVRVEPSQSDNRRFLRPPGTVVAIHTASGREEFGSGLPAAEIGWLRETVAFLLSEGGARVAVDGVPVDGVPVGGADPAPRKTWKMPPP